MDSLAESDAHVASRLVASTLFHVLRLDALAVLAVIVVVVDVAVLRRILDRVGVVRRYLRHLCRFPS